MEDNHEHSENDKWHQCYCYGHGHGRFMAIRLILGLAILAIVFLIGLKIGEFKGEFGSGYGRHGMMMGDYGRGYYAPEPMPYPLMMQGGAKSAPGAVQATPPTNSSNSNK
jgi:hypothetical protein